MMITQFSTINLHGQQSASSIASELELRLQLELEAGFRFGLEMLSGELQLLATFGIVVGAS